MADKRPLTREDLRDELQRFALDTLKQDLPDIVSQVRGELREELHRCLLQWSPALPPALSPRDSGEPAKTADAMSSWRQRLHDVREGEEDEEDVEVPPMTRPQLQEEALQGSPPRQSSYVNASAVARARASGTSTSAASGLSTSATSESVRESGHQSHFSQETQAAAHSREQSRTGRGSSNHGTASDWLGGLWVERSRSPAPTGGTLKSHNPLLRSQVEHRSSGGGTAGYRHAREASLRSSGSSISLNHRVVPKRPTIWSRQGTLRVPPPEGSGLARLVSSAYFDYGTGLLILLNAASIGVQADYMARNVTSEVPATFRGLELSFCAAFTVELLLRIWVYRRHFFCSPDWIWNIFDCLLVLLQLAEEFMSFFALQHTASNSGVATDLSIMRILRILRLIRIIRLVRILRLIGELRTIVASIAGSLRSLCWTVLLLMMMMYLVGVYLTQLSSDHRVSSNDPDNFGKETDMNRFFGSLGSAILALYQVITGGLNWHLLADPLMNEISPWLVLLLCLYIAFSLFALMNVVTGVFVESALATAKTDRDRFLLEFVRKLFTEVDKDASGSITWEEFSACLASKEMQMYFEAFELDIQEAKNLFVLLDVDESGEVEFEEFVNGCFRLRGPAKALDLAMLVTNLNRWCYEFLDFAKDVDAKLMLVMEAMKLSIQDASAWQPPCTREGSMPSAAHQHLSSFGSRNESCKDCDVESDTRDWPKPDSRKTSPISATNAFHKYFAQEEADRSNTE